MKIKQIIDIINKNQEFCEIIAKYHHNISNLNILNQYGEIPEYAKQEDINKELLDYDRKIYNLNKPKLDEVITEYKQWLETEINE